MKSETTQNSDREFMDKISIIDKKVLVIIRGASGSGKSTYIKTNFPTAFVCSADYYHINDEEKYEWCFENAAQAHIFSKNACKAAMINNLPLIAIDNTNTQIFEMEPYIKLAKRYGYTINIIRLDVEPEISAPRNVHNVPFEVVKTQYKRIMDLPKNWSIEEKIIKQ